MNKYYIMAFAVVMIAFSFITARGITTNSIVVDEYAHLPAGVAYWRKGLFSMYDENPPLLRYIMAAPAFASGAKMDYSRVGTSRRWEWAVGNDFRLANKSACTSYFLAGRFTIAAIAIGGGLLIFTWCKRNEGVLVGIVCSSLWLLDPNVAAHSSIATTDIGTTFFCLLATVAFFGFLCKPSMWNTTFAGTTLGLALGAKFSMLTLLPVWFFVSICSCSGIWPKHTPNRPRLLDLVAILLLALIVLNGLYQFRGTPTRLDSLNFISPMFSGMDPSVANGDLAGNRYLGTWIGQIPLPIPRDYLVGLDSQMFDQQVGYFGNLRDGKLVHVSPWYDPFRTLVYKLPVGTLLLAAYAGAFWVRRAVRNQFPNLLLVLVPAILMVTLCMKGGSLKAPLRYSLPAIPFVILLISRPVHDALKHRLGRAAIIVCLIWNVTSLVASYPDYFAYGNEIVGGQSGARQVFLGSNYDWGQDLLLLKVWTDSHPEIGPIAFSYYGSVHPAEVNMKTRALPSVFARPDLPPSEPADGTFYWAVSANVLRGMPGLMEIDGTTRNEGILNDGFLKEEKAAYRVGATFFVFRVFADGSQKQPGDLFVSRLSGCIRQIGEQDIIGAP